MPYLQQLVEGDKEIRDFVGSMLSLKIELPIVQLTRMEWWASSFDEPGPDYNLFKFFADDTTYPVKTHRVEGY